MASKIEVVITVEDAAKGDIEKVSHALSELGLDQATALSSVGIISGFADADALMGLRAAPGVKSVEPAGKVSIAPPDADVQ